MIKPIYGAASIGVVRVNDMEALRATYKRVAKEMAGARIVDGAMQAGAADADETDQVPPPSRSRDAGGPCGCLCSCLWGTPERSSWLGCVSAHCFCEQRDRFQPPRRFV